MAFKLSPVLNDQQFSNAGILLSGGKIETYLAGSSTPATTYTSQSGSVAQANPIILNSRGEVDNLIYLTTGISYKLVLKDSLNNVLRTYDNIEGVNDSSLTIDQWVNSGVTPVFVNATQFTLAGDQTSAFQVNRRVKLLVTAGTVYGYISSSAFAALTTVTVVLDSGVLDSGLSSVQLGLVTPNNTSFPTNELVGKPLQKQTYTAFTTGGTSSAFTLTPSPAITANATGTRFNITLNAAPTGSPTLAVSGQAAKGLKYYNATGTKQFITSAVAPSGWNSDVIDDGTDWVMVSPNRRQIAAAGVTGYTTSATLTAADFGNHVYYNSASAGTLTLPSASAAPAGSIISISNIIGAGVCTIARADASVIFAFGQVSVTSISLNPGDSIQLGTDGANWVQVVGSKSLGVGQTWQDVTGSRAVNTTYTNTTGKQIMVLISGNTASGTKPSFSINGVAYAKVGTNAGANVLFTLSVIIPALATYILATNAVIEQWSELR